jgi:hypothetical protein
MPIPDSDRNGSLHAVGAMVDKRIKDHRDAESSARQY